MSKQRRTSSQPVVHNKKARHRYEILERLECGIALKGTEVKSLRGGSVSLDEAYARLDDDGEVWLIGCHIAPYEQGNTLNHDPDRPRKLLAHRREIRKWLPKVRTRGLTLVPLEIRFNDRGLAKVIIGLVRGKSVADKRQDLKKREHQREIDRVMRR